jgi:N-acetylglutamate synthase-like GNAT family acetyltransferase
MEKKNMKIEPLKIHPELFEKMNLACFEEFHYFSPKLSIEDFAESLEHKLNTDKLPIFYVAFEEETFIGGFALREYDEKIAKDFSPPLKNKYSPWLGSLVVFFPFRGRGFGKLLVEIAKEKTREFGYKELYFFTDKEEFYEKLGFKIIEETMLNGNPVSIMAGNA